MKTYTYEDIVKKYSEAVANQAMASNAEATGRVIYPAFESEHADKNEWACDPIQVGNDQITACYYLTEEDEQDLESFDWDGHVEFQVEEGMYI